MPFTLFTLGLFLLLGALPLPGQTANRHLEVAQEKALRLTYDYTTLWPKTGIHQARFYLPFPPETPTQHILSFHSTLKGQYLAEGSHPPHKLLTSLLHYNSSLVPRFIHWRVVVTGLFRMRSWTDGPPLLSPTSILLAPAAGDFLDSSETINWDTACFRGWLRENGLERRQVESTWHLARRIYDHLRENGSYTYPPETAWNASAACRNLSTDCGGFSIVFVAACRANHIPARLLVGQWFKTRQIGEGDLAMTGHQSHVYAEFFDPQLGWVPVDLSSTLLHVKSRESGDFFGQDPGFFLVWHHDSDFHLSTPEKPDEHVQWMQNPAIWFAPEAKSSAEESDHHWTLETIASAEAPP